MTYTKPEIVVLGDAASVIQAHDKGCCLLDSVQGLYISPAYDLDE